MSSEQFYQAEGPCGGIGQQPWTNNPVSRTDAGRADFEPSPEVAAWLEGAPSVLDVQQGEDNP